MIALREINFQDLTYTLIKPLLWSIVETQLAVVVVNLPLLKPIVVRVVPFIQFGTHNSQRATTTVTGSQRFRRLGEPATEGYILRTMEVSIATREKPSSQTSLFEREV